MCKHDRTCFAQSKLRVQNVCFIKFMTQQYAQTWRKRKNESKQIKYKQEKGKEYSLKVCICIVMVFCSCLNNVNKTPPT